MMTRRLPLIALVLITAFVTGTLLAQERAPSTAAALKRAVEIATLLENDPLNKNAKALRSDLLFFIIQAPDIRVHLCSGVLGDGKKIKGDYESIIFAQLTFSQAKFVIEHPDQAGDRNQESLAGVEGVLRTYKNIKLAKPKAKVELLEELLAKQQAGQLAEYVKTAAAAGCKG
ncbi:MAG TPA: hypothetical protein VNO50_04550 [Pyrinomonadaceae bacterium]|nr:hypothetical protein [Pyrinomonadaceae bacterium]